MKSGKRRGRGNQGKYKKIPDFLYCIAFFCVPLGPFSPSCAGAFAFPLFFCFSAEIFGIHFSSVVIWFSLGECAETESKCKFPPARSSQHRCRPETFQGFLLCEFWCLSLLSRSDSRPNPFQTRPGHAWSKFR